MHFSAAEIVEATGGTLRHGARAATARRRCLDGIGIDSRRLVEGMLFVALRNERDGHGFIEAALRAGAGGYLAEAGFVPPADLVPERTAAIEVADTAVALAAIGEAARRRMDGPVVAITGSVGKTSTKDLTAAALGRTLVVSASERSFNNELGVPLTLANACDDTDVVVVEMGARAPGHLRHLCGIARPTIGVVTAVGAAHTETFGSLAGVAAAKSELIESLPSSGTAILNCDDSRVAAMASRSAAPVVTFSAQGRPGAAVVAEAVSLDDELRPRFDLRSPWGSAHVALEARGGHQVANALAAAAVALCCGVSLEATVAGLAGARMGPGRMELRRAPSGAVVVDDSYNANPTSMAAALRSLAALPARRRVAAVGIMAELGAEEEEAHAEMAQLAQRLGIEVVAVGTDLYGPGASASIEEAANRIGVPGATTAVLVKASRVAGLERLVELLAPNEPARRAGP